MSIRSTHPLGFMLFSRPTSILAKPCNIPRAKAATARLGMHIHNPPKQALPLKHHSTAKQPSQTPRPPPSSPEPPTKNPLPAPTDRTTHSEQVQTPTDTDMEDHIPGFSKLGVGAKLVAIRSLKSDLATEIQKKDTEWKIGAYEAVMEGLGMKEKEIRGGRGRIRGL